MTRESFDLPHLADLVPGFHWAVKQNGLVFLAGMIGLDQEGQVVEGYEAQVRQSLENVNDTLALAGSEPSDIVQFMAFLKTGSDLPFPDQFGMVVAAKEEILPGSAPAGTAVRVDELFFPNLLIEIQVIAAVSR